MALISLPVRQGGVKSRDMENGDNNINKNHTKSTKHKDFAKSVYSKQAKSLVKQHDESYIDTVIEIETVSI